MPKYKLNCEEYQSLKLNKKVYRGGDTVDLSEEEAAKLPKHLKLKKLPPGRPAGAGSALYKKQSPEVNLGTKDTPKESEDKTKDE